MSERLSKLRTEDSFRPVFYQGDILFHASFGGRAILKEMCDVTFLTAEISDFPTDVYAYFPVEFIGKGKIVWQYVGDGIYLKPETLNTVGEYIRKYDPSFEWLDTVVTEHNNGRCRQLVCTNGVWTYTQ